MKPVEQKRVEWKEGPVGRIAQVIAVGGQIVTVGGELDVPTTIPSAQPFHQLFVLGGGQGPKAQSG